MLPIFSKVLTGSMVAGAAASLGSSKQEHKQETTFKKIKSITTNLV